VEQATRVGTSLALAALAAVSYRCTYDGGGRATLLKRSAVRSKLIRVIIIRDEEGPWCEGFEPVSRPRMSWIELRHGHSRSKGLKIIASLNLICWAFYLV